METDDATQMHQEGMKDYYWDTWLTQSVEIHDCWVLSSSSPLGVEPT